MKPRLVFYTNIPTPYQTDFFAALSVYVTLTVVYYATTERGRQWEIPPADATYQTIWLRDGRLARWLQRWIRDYHFSWSVLGTARRLPADYVIVSGSYWTPNSVVVMLLARRQGQKVAFFGERLAGRVTGWRAMLKRGLLWPLRVACGRVFAIGHEAAQTYVQWGFGAAVSVVPYSIRIEPFISEQPLSDSVGGPLIVLSVGALIPRKGMDVLIRAFQRLPATEFDQVRLHILGDGPERHRLAQLIGTDERIRLLGFADADERIRHFRQAHVFALASQYDGWGVVINEAIAAGLPIISSTAVGAAREWVTPGQNGFLCAPGDVAAFARAIRQLIEQADLRHRFASHNRQWRTQTSSAHFAARLYQDVVTDLAA